MIYYEQLFFFLSKKKKHLFCPIFYYETDQHCMVLILKKLGGQKSNCYLSVVLFLLFVNYKFVRMNIIVSYDKKATLNYKLSPYA